MSAFKTACSDFLTVDGARYGISKGGATYVDRLIRTGIADLQRFIPQLRTGQKRVYKLADVVTSGEASIGDLPEGATLRDAYFVVTGCPCFQNPVLPYNWQHRQELVCGRPRILGGQYLMAIDPYATEFYLFPALTADNEFWLFYDGIKTDFQPTEETRLGEEEAQAVAYYVKAHVAREADHDLVASASYWVSYAGSPQVMGLRTKLYLDWKQRGVVPFGPDSEMAGVPPCNAPATCPDAEPVAPAAPVLTMNIESDPDNVILEWSQESDPDSNQVWRSINGGEFVLLATVDGNLTTYTDTDGMAAGDINAYKIKAVTGELESEFSNEGVALNEHEGEEVGPDVSHETWLLMFGDAFIGDPTSIESISLPNLLSVSGTLFLGGYEVLTSLDLSGLIQCGLTQNDHLVLNGSLLLETIDLPSLVRVGGDFRCNGSASLVTLNLPVLESTGEDGIFSADGCPNLTTVSIPELLVQDVEYHWDSCALSATSVEHILSRAVAAPASGSTRVYLDGGSSAGLASLSAQGQADFATLLGSIGDVTINP